MVIPVTFSPHTSSDSQIYKQYLRYLDSPFIKNLDSKASLHEVPAEIEEDIDEIKPCSENENCNVRPPPQIQLESIRKLLSNLELKTISSGDAIESLYFINSEWFSSWYEYVTLSSKSLLPPGSIDNTYIISGEGGDAVAVPLDVWNALQSWYSGGPIITNSTMDLKFSQSLLDRDTVLKYFPRLLSHSHPNPSPSVSTTATAAPSANLICFVCHKNANLRCSRCSGITYCSKACQQIHWKFHKSNCCVKGEKDNDKDISAVPILPGLYNLGNSCYMNSSLQCLLHIQPLSRYFLSQRHLTDLNKESRHGTGGLLVDHYAKLLEEVYFLSPARSKSRSVGAPSPISPRDFKTALGRINRDYAGLVQHDAHELVRLTVPLCVFFRLSRQGPLLRRSSCCWTSCMRT